MRYHTRGGRLVRVTSGGDIPSACSETADESLFPIQRRACPMGFFELARNNCSSRILYPMIRRRGERGDVSSFERVSWDDALDNTADCLSRMVEEGKSLGYLPVWDIGGVTPFLGLYLSAYGNPSNGNLNSAKFAALGLCDDTAGAPVTDIFKSKFVLAWASDPTTTWVHQSFILTKAREAEIPVTVIEARYTDSVGALANSGDDTPRFLCIRPGTDGALIAAMMCVIYDHGLHDADFLRRHCFGFFPDDRITSVSPASDPATGVPFNGKRCSVPDGESFLEYMESLKKNHGGTKGVLRWAASLCGISQGPGAIAAVALKYASSKPAFLLSGYHGGAQRTRAGMYYSWMLIALAAMTGNIGREGGGIGDLRMSSGRRALFSRPGLKTPRKKYPALKFAVSQMNRVLLEGTDGRTPEQMRSDALAACGVDLGADARLRISMLMRGAANGDPFNQYPNINRRLNAWKNLKHVVSQERFWTATARFSDIVLPAASSLEDGYLLNNANGDAYVVASPLEPPGEARPDWWITEQIAARVGIEFEPRTETDTEIRERQWRETENAAPFTMEELIEKGHVQAPPPERKVFPAYPTDTGRINFYSCYLAERGRLVHGIPAARYVTFGEDWERALNNGGIIGRKGLLYPLQLITPHVRQRGNASYDNVEEILKLFPRAASLHPSDAETRGIVENDNIYAYSDVGCLKIKAHITRTVMPGTVLIGEGVWYSPCETETYEAIIDGEKRTVPVDTGGNPNTILDDHPCGALDPFYTSEGMAANGEFCEVSLHNPG